MIRVNSHKYSVSALCRVLKISRSIYYYKSKEKADLSILAKLGHRVSRRRIARIMSMKGLVSKYTIAKFKPQLGIVNEEKADNLVERKFNDQEHLQVVVSDLTYVRVGNVWNYDCLLIEICLTEK